MKSIIMYYYGMKNIIIEKNESEIIIVENNKKYRLTVIDKKLENILKILQQDRRFNFIVPTVEGNLVLEINNSRYILEEIETISNIEYIYNEQKVISKTSNGKIWIELWKRKIEQIEKNKSKLKGSSLDSIYSYYIGMAENAVQILSAVEDERYDLVVCHKRYVDQNNSTNCNATIDYKEREISNIIKYLYNTNKAELNKYISKLKNVNKKLLIARLIFPIEYFDTVDKYILKGVEENKREEIEENEKFIKWVIQELNIEEVGISWIKKES